MVLEKDFQKKWESLNLVKTIFAAHVEDKKFAARFKVFANFGAPEIGGAKLSQNPRYIILH
jgi:hypothetical protein